MRKVFFIGLTLSAFMVGCKKASPVPAGSSNSSSVAMGGTTNPKDISSFTYFNAKGLPMNEKDINYDLEDMVLLVEDGSTEIDAKVTYFETEASAYNYCKGYSKYDQIRASIDKIRIIRALAIKTGDINKKDGEPFSAEMKQLLEDMGINMQQKPTGIGILYDFENGTGSTCGLSGNPQFSLFSFKNKAESVRGIGLLNALFNKTWWRGSSRWFILGTGGLIPFGGLHFKNMAESAW